MIVLNSIVMLKFTAEIEEKKKEETERDINRFRRKRDGSVGLRSVPAKVIRSIDYIVFIMRLCQCCIYFRH